MKKQNVYKRNAHMKEKECVGGRREKQIGGRYMSLQMPYGCKKISIQLYLRKKKLL
uniref:Uncharacterized protein n=1 Tax=Octopus bimaculoides TaxID=37653 RepID=A0A0L8HR95_OCTBM